jgi:hypothetical protein
MAYTDLLSGIFYHLIMTNASFLKKSLQILWKKFAKELRAFRLKGQIAVVHPFVAE